MNLWECGEPSCKTSCVGTGGAMGLRAIGWWFMPGPRLFCPLHRPDAVRCRINAMGHGCLMGGREGCPDPCSLCTGENEAEWIQKAIPGLLETYPPEWLSSVLNVDAESIGGLS